jgi:beta-1,4-mannosyltransferase
MASLKQLGYNRNFTKQINLTRYVANRLKRGGEYVRRRLICEPEPSRKTPCVMYMPDKIRVYPLPPQLVSNPYLDQLYGHVSDPRLMVRRVRPAWRGLIELLSGRGPRIWHVHFFDEITQRPERSLSWLRTEMFLRLVALVCASGARVIWTAHNIEPHELYHADLARRAYQAMLQRAHIVFVHSRAAGETLVERYGRPRRLEIIPIGNWIGLAGPIQARDISRARLGWPRGVRVVLGLGTLRPYKGFEDLIEAFRPVANPNTRLLIAGHPQDPAYAARLVERCADLPCVQIQSGYVSDAELPYYLAAADVVALPYRKLLTSAMLMWPLSYAAPVVVPAFSPVTELLEDGISGFLYSPQDVRGLSQALERALQHPDLASVGRAGYSVAARFDWNAIGARVAELYVGLNSL